MTVAGLHLLGRWWQNLFRQEAGVSRKGREADRLSGRLSLRLRSRDRQDPGLSRLNVCLRMAHHAERDGYFKKLNRGIMRVVPALAPQSLYGPTDAHQLPPLSQRH